MKIKPLLTTLLATTAVLAAQETKLRLSDLPAPVQKAAQSEKARGAVLKGFAKEVEKGATFYEVETTVSGHRRDLLFDATGKIVEVEEAVESQAVPAAAMKALRAKGTVTTVERVTRGESVSYEAVVKAKSGKDVELAVNADGTPVKP